MSGFRRWLQNELGLFLSSRSDPVMTRLRARLPSALAEAQFKATITITWASGVAIDEHQQAIVGRRLISLARSAAREHSVLDPDESRAAVNQALGNYCLRDVGQELVAVSAQLEVGPEDLRIAEEREGFRRQTALTREQRLAEVERLRLLADQILATPTVARLWWLEGKPGRLEELVAKGKDEMFEKVAELFGLPANRPAADPIAELVRQFLEGLDARFREQLISQLHVVFTSYERHDLAEKLNDYEHPQHWRST